MHHAARVFVLALIAGLMAAPPVAASAIPAGPVTTAAAPAAPLSTAKVVIVVGATHGSTSHYRDIAEGIYAEAIQHSTNVIRIYSPNATWSVVRPALQGASVVVYLGHGNGWPSPYTYDPNMTTKNGMGLNATAGNGDNNVKYYGEPSLATVALAPNAVVFLNHLCYASGNSEPDHPDPTLSVAMQRVDNYGAGFIKAGAKAVIAEGHGSINGMIEDLFTTQQTILDVWRGQHGSNGHEFSFLSGRSPGYTAFMDPENADSGFYRSLVGNPNLRTEDVAGQSSTPSTAPAPQDPMSRVFGADRYATAAAISNGWGAGVPVVYVATGLNFPDALAGAAAAGGLGAPLLLVSATSVPAATAAELARLQPGRIVVLGGPGAVSDAVLNSLSAYTAGGVTRVFGADRYATAAAISNGWGAGVPVVYVATGLNFPDALAGAAAAGGLGAPLLLVSATSVPAATAAELARLQPGRIVVLGGPGAVSDAVLNSLSAYTAGGVTRVFGADRYATAAAISNGWGAGVPVVYVATGLNFPDALAGAAAAGGLGAPLLLVSATSVPAATAAELARLQPGRIVVLGGPGAVSDAVLAQLRAYAGS